MLLSINFYSFIKCCRPTQMPFTGNWPRGSATNRRPNPRIATNAVAPARSNNFVRGHGSRLRGHSGRGYGEPIEHGGYGGHGGHTLPASTILYTEALRSIVSVG